MPKIATDLIEIDNTQLVGITGGGRWITVGIPVPQMTKTEALVHAAWLVAVVNDDDQFKAILQRVRNT